MFNISLFYFISGDNFTFVIITRFHGVGAKKKADSYRAQSDSWRYQRSRTRVTPHWRACVGRVRARASRAR